MKVGMLGGLISTTIYFSFYESIRKEVAIMTNHPILIPLFTALTARTLTTCLIFPLEYWRTLQQNTVGHNKKAGY